MIVTHIYKEHKFKRNVKTFCRLCNKKLRRVISTCFTMNPWNKLSYEENVAERKKILDKEENKLIKNGVVCKQCRDANDD